MTTKSFMEMDVDEFEDKSGKVVDKPSLDFDFDDDEETSPANDVSDTTDMTAENNDEPSEQTTPEMDDNDQEQSTSQPQSNGPCRAQFKDKAYFDEYISKQRERIEKFSIVKYSGVYADKILDGMYMNLISAEYSDGMSKADMIDDVNSLFSCVKDVDNYGNMVDYLSLAILFNVSGDKISSILSNKKLDDDLVSKLKKALGSTSSNGNGVKYESYQTFDDMLNDKISPEEFINYIETKWYDDSKERYWYNSHNSSEDVYTGYWCWVGAAIAQIKGIDVSDSKYIPYELIDKASPTIEAFIQEGMFDAGFGNLRLKIAKALGDKFKVTNVVKGMGGKDKFDITETDADYDGTKTTVESTGTGCKVVSRGDGKFKCHFTNIPLSQALNKILALFEKPELLLEGAFYNISRSGGKLYMEDGEENTDNDDTSDELPKPPEDDSEDEDADDSSSNEEATTEEDDIDISSFGSDTSDVQNEYDPGDIEILNKLIASENEAINDYFDGTKDTKDENLRTLYGDIGHEERFHLEQLLYAKSTLTGEKYEPRDPEVKKEYEELIAGGMDEDTAASTAIDKTSMFGSDNGDDSDIEELEQEAALIETMLVHNEILTTFCESQLDLIRGHHIIDKSVNVIMESFIQEEVDNVTTAPKQITKIQNPIALLAKGLKASINGLLRLSSVIKDSVAKSKVKNHRKYEWIKKHGIGELFKSGRTLTHQLSM